MYLGTQYISTQNVLKHIVKYFLSTLIFSFETAFTATLHTKAHVIYKKGIEMEK